MGTCPDRRACLALLAALAAAVGSGCEMPPGADQGALPPSCDKCHQASSLTRVLAIAPPREWMTVKGRGLVRRMTLTTSTSREYAFTFVKRGNHADGAAASCPGCHPVSSEGARHGLSQYPQTARPLAFSPKQDCAPACHDWLKSSVVSTGFTPKSGKAPTYSGSLRPHDLLLAASGGHADIYLKGYTKSAGAAIGVGRIKRGCAGCHNTQNDKHGSVTDCLNCHRFEGQTGKVHLLHVKAIGDGRAKLDPGHAGESGCNYCHGLSDSSAGLYRAACYACHLSGHQVLDSGGKAHFWQL